MTTRGRGAIAVATMWAIAPGCAFAGPSQQVAPLSRVAITNVTDEARLARMTWIDGMVQVARADPRTTSYFSGAIGTSGFPVLLEGLTDDCELIGSVEGFEPGSYGLLTIHADDVTLTPLVAGDASWLVASSVEACGATPQEPPPPDLPRTPEPGVSP